MSLIGTSTPSSNLAARTSPPFIASMDFLHVPTLGFWGFLKITDAYPQAKVAALRALAQL